MGKFLKNSTSFLCFVIVIIYLLQGLISFRIKNKAITGYDNWDVTTNINAEIVLLGSSRCWVHFDPHFFEKTYHLKTVNIGMNGHSELPASILRLENYLAKNKSPKYAILSFDPSITPSSFKDNNNFVNKNNYGRFAFLPSKENSDLIDYFKFDNCEKYIPLYAMFKYQLIQDAITLKKSRIFKEGFELNDEQWDTLKYPISAVMKKHFVKTDKIYLLKEQLKKLKLLCQKNNIQLICIQTPVYKSNYDSFIFNRSSEICKSINIPFIDANSVKIRNSIDNFYNSTHLNKKGVIEMNKLLKNEKQLTAILK
jgi:hypothetical protein